MYKVSDIYRLDNMSFDLERKTGSFKNKQTSYEGGLQNLCFKVLF